MPDREQGDHWDFLAADLGATPAPDKETEKQPVESPAEEEVKVVEEATFESSVERVVEVSEPGPADVPPEEAEKRQRGQKGGRVVSGFGYRRGGVDWANLARELGVEALEEAPEPIPATDATEGPEVSTIVLSEKPVSVEERRDRKDRPSRRAEPTAHPAVSGFGAGIIEDLIPEEAAPHEAEKEIGEGEESQEERKGRRRRRRRKPRRPEEEQTPETVSVEEAESAAAGEESSEEEGGRRRGRRRGGRKRGAREEVSAETEEFGAGVIADHPGKNDADDFDMLLDDDEDEDEEECDGEDSTETGRSQEERGKERRQGKKITHRGIPSWEEAVGHIIDSNLESRSKRPEPSGPRQHSGRRRGGEHNGNRKRP